MANSIELKGRKFTVFVNADAMGKSLQGAGGALVLGSVFESILNRNKIVKSSSDIYPEKWIKEAFLELHHVFETFDGSMLVSLVIGLVDDENGLLYMINAEHPWTILYRDGKASFINTKDFFRKLGTIGARGYISIFTEQLYPGDVLISGSDGRDDILIPTEAGDDLMNENESMILNHVEKCNAKLDGIYSEILSVGKPIDDMTLVKVTYKKELDSSEEVSSIADQEIYIESKNLLKTGKFSEVIILLEAALISGKRSAIIYKNLFQAYLQTNSFDKAASISEELIKLMPGNTEILFQTSFVLKKIGNYAVACDLGERVKMRKPLHIKNLINLADSHFFNGNRQRALSLINMALELEIENQYAIKRKKIFEKNLEI